MGFWAAMDEVYPTARQQRCWQHKTMNVLNCLPKLSQPTQVRQLRVDFWGLALSGANKINGLMVPSCLNPRSPVVARQSKNTFDMKVP